MEVAIVAYEPADQTKEELAKGRVDIEEVGSFEVIGCKLLMV